MNVLDYSIKAGKQLRKTIEGRNLLEVLKVIDEKYHNNDAYDMYIQRVRDLEKMYYFASYDIAYHQFIAVLEDKDFKDKNLFINTAELLKSDSSFSDLIEISNEFARIFTELAQACLGGQNLDSLFPKTWKYQSKNAVSNVQIAAKRTLMQKNFKAYNQKKRNFIYSDESKNYLDLKEKKKYLPFSNESIKFFHEHEELPNEEKMLYEKMHLIREAIDKGLYYGFFGNIPVINDVDIIEGADVEKSFLKETKIVHENLVAAFASTWLYKIQLKNIAYYYMANSKNVTIEHGIGKASIVGVVYPSDDRGIFDDSMVI